MTDFSPREIVSELDRFIVGQHDAKRAVAIALRNRWRRLRLEGSMRDEVLPKNILMIGPTGCGKTEISRRLAKLAGAPFLKVEATKFTEVGYVGRDVEQIVRDLVETAIAMIRDDKRKWCAQGRSLRRRSVFSTPSSARAPRRRPATASAKSCAPANSTTRTSRSSWRRARGGMPMFELPNMPGVADRRHLIGDHFRQGDGQDAKPRRTTVKEATAPLITEESDKLVDQDQVVREAIQEVEKMASFSSTRSTRSARARRAAAPMSRARACSATCCR